MLNIHQITRIASPEGVTSVDGTNWLTVDVTTEDRGAIRIDFFADTTAPLEAFWADLQARGAVTSTASVSYIASLSVHDVETTRVTTGAKASTIRVEAYDKNDERVFQACLFQAD